MMFVRMFLAWVLLAALPMQGYAAAAMLYCGMGGGHAAAAATHHESSKARHAASPPVQGHDGHAQSGKHGQHGQDGQDGQTPPPLDDVSGHARAAGEGAGAASPALDHSCSACSACSHSVALSDTPHFVKEQPVPTHSGTHDLGPFPTRPAPVPDKPPRA